MRHSVYGYKLSRNKDERGRLFTSLVTSLLTYGYLETSQTKAKAIKGLVDKIINLAKDKKRPELIKPFITDQNLLDRLVKEVLPKLENRTSGYTSLVKLGTRYGDRTMMVKMSLIGVGEMKAIEKVKSAKFKVQSEKKVEKVEKKVTPKKNTKPVRRVKATVRRKGKAA